jgi:NAD(P)H-dependent FMN reductase
VLGTVHNAIDWLAMRWNHGALHGKPLAVIGSGTLQRDLAPDGVRSVGGEECGVGDAT